MCRQASRLVCGLTWPSVGSPLGAWAAGLTGLCAEGGHILLLISPSPTQVIRLLLAYGP